MNKILEKINLKYKQTKINKYIHLYEFENESLLIVIESKNNVFKINRKDFYEIDDLLLPYLFVLIDTNTQKKYCIKINEPNNFLRNAFENTKKDEVYFGKQILQCQSSDDYILKELKILGG